MKIEGFFSGIKNANVAVEKLKNAGYANSKVDLNDHYISDMHHSPRLPGTETCPNLSSLVLNTGDFKSDDSPSAIKAASPMVSGMGGFEEITDINYKVTVESDDANARDVKNIIKKLGGDFKNPNLDLPDRIK